MPLKDEEKKEVKVEEKKEDKAEEKKQEEKVEEKKPEKILITKEVIFYDRATKQKIMVKSIGEFANQYNLDKQNLYKVANGKMKSYKNLELYNPFKHGMDFGQT